MRLIFMILFLFSVSFGYAVPLPNYSIMVKDGQFDPEKIEVPAEQRFKITIQNTGSDPVEFENLSLRVEKVLGKNVQSFVVIHPLKSGIYHFIDEFHPHMTGFKIIAKE
ncbi:MAG: hypothetical protein JSC085_000337 [Candidatus Tokpelaia sp. JSC085]|nr:MAG: hypothetical protein JSC085_000337 [Candidatus Tokpelaia sp. JSC085]